MGGLIKNLDTSKVIIKELDLTTFKIPDTYFSNRYANSELQNFNEFAMWTDMCIQTARKDNWVEESKDLFKHRFSGAIGIMHACDKLGVPKGMWQNVRKVDRLLGGFNTDKNDMKILVKNTWLNHYKDQKTGKISYPPFVSLDHIIGITLPTIKEAHLTYEYGKDIRIEMLLDEKVRLTLSNESMEQGWEYKSTTAHITIIKKEHINKNNVYSIYNDYKLKKFKDIKVVCDRLLGGAGEDYSVYKNFIAMGVKIEDPDVVDTIQELAREYDVPYAKPDKWHVT